MTQARIKTGIRKDSSFDENLEAVRVAVARYGVETVIDRLQEIRELFYWIKSDPNWQDQIDSLVSQLEYDAYVLPKLIEEIEIDEIVSEGGARARNAFITARYGSRTDSRDLMVIRVDWEKGEEFPTMTLQKADRRADFIGFESL